VTKKLFENTEIFNANSEKSERFRTNSEKCKCMFNTLMQLFHDRSFGNILTEASKDWLILERVTLVASTGAEPIFRESKRGIVSNSELC
jgi:hypothetical protein